MRGEPIIQRKGFDWITLGLYLSLVIIGWLMQFAVHYDAADPYAFLRFNSPMGKASIISLVALVFFFSGYVIEWKFWSTFAYPIYGITIVFLLAVLLFGSNIKGSQSWFNFFGFSLQPSEFTKFGAALAVAAYLSYYKQHIVEIRILSRGFLLVLLPVFLILLQPDAGSAMVFLSLIFVFYRGGISVYYLLVPAGLLLTFILSLIYGIELVSFLVLLVAMLFLAIVYYQNRYVMLGTSVVAIILGYLYYSGTSGLSVIVAALLFIALTLVYWFRNQKNSSLFIIPTVIVLILFGLLTNYVFEKVLQPHQQDRINVWLRPEKSDPRGALYNIIQSKMAIGSGGLEGKGFLKGTMTNLDYVPEQSTDFIFSTVGEEQGFIGALSIIVLYLLLMLRIILIGERSNNKFTLFYAYAIASFFFVHFFVNIGMTMGIVPVIGIPLPFLSKGGSALIAFSLMLGVLLKLDVSRRIR
jgi:rod shape determining protein RodA